MKESSKYRAVKSGYAAKLIRRLGIGFCLILACSTASAIPLSGDQTTGVISVAGEVDDFTFDAVAGETIVLRVADTSVSNFFPRIELYDPSGDLVASGAGQFVGTATAVATVSGGYTASVRDDSVSGPNDTGVGSYVLNFVQTLGTVELSQLANDSENLETIDQGDLDTYTLSANVGDTLVLRVTDTSDSAFFPRVELYDPNGVFVTLGEGQAVGTATHVAALAGTYRVLVLDDSASGGDDSSFGDYNLRFARLTDANELGELANDSENRKIFDQGDLDTYILSANVGDTLVLRVTDTSDSAFFPRVELYDPNGAFVTFGEGQAVGTATHVAALAGTYRVLVRDDSASGGDDSSFGDYNLRFTRLTDANELGELANDSENLESIDQGDLDTYTLTANVGDTLVLRVTDTSDSDFFPRVELYDPNGVFVTLGEGQAVGTATHVAALAGTYRVLVRDDSASGGDDSSFGDYNLRFARLTDANELGELANDSENLKTLAQGDLDTYILSANAGDTLVLRVTDTSGSAFFPRVELYDPNGVFVTLGEGQAVGTATHVAALAGTYRVLVRDDSASGGDDSSFGDYNLRFARLPGANELGLILSGTSVTETIDLGDLDTYILSAASGAEISLQIEDLTNTGFYPRVELYAPDGSLIAAASGQIIGSTTVETTQAGIFSLLVRDDSASGGSDSGAGVYLLSLNVTGGNGDGPTYTVGITPPTELNLDNMPINQGLFILERVVGYSAINLGADLLMAPITIDATIGSGRFNELLQIPIEFEVLNLIGRFEATDPGKPPARFDHIIGPVDTTGPLVTTIALPLLTTDSFFQITDSDSGVDTFIDGSAEKPEVSQISLFENLEIFDGRDTWFIGYRGEVIRGEAAPGQPHGGIGSPSNSGSTPVNNNNSPTVNDDEVSINEGQTVEFVFTGSDPEGQTLTWAFIDILGDDVTQQPTFDPNTQEVIWDSSGSPAPASYSIRVFAIDQKNLGDIGVLTVNVLANVLTPNVIGLTQSDAETNIFDVGLTVGNIGSANSNTVPAGSVISQTPAAGSSVASGTAVDLVISLGVADVIVPSITGLAQAAAEADILGAGLTVGNIGSANSNTVPADSVISQSPAAGSSAAPGTAVDLVISLGVADVIVPSISGLTQSVAEANILGAGLTVGNIGSANSNTVPAGSVISQTPAAGSSVTPGTAVDLVISLGVADVIVPSISGLTQAVAEANILGAGLTVGNIGSANSNTVPAGSVISQTPAAGSSVAPDTAVDLVISLGVADVIVPSITGLTQAVAEANILSAGLTVGNIGSANSNTVPAGSVISQSPIGSTAATPGSSVDFVVSEGPATVSLICDADGNSSIDIFDIRAISRARGQTALPDDVRDANGDGLISILDARTCVLQCTNARCTP